jgi:hypothetical protein
MMSLSFLLLLFFKLRFMASTNLLKTLSPKLIAPPKQRKPGYGPIQRLR